MSDSEATEIAALSNASKLLCAQVEIETAVYIQSIEVGENRGSWSIVGIKAWDRKSGLWQTLYKGVANTVRYEHFKATYQYNKLSPSPLCETTFKSSTIRIELGKTILFSSVK